MSYIPEGTEEQSPPAVVKAEEDGYNYFAERGDPNLVRVVQYAAMYQAFSAFDVAQSGEKPPADSRPDSLLIFRTVELLGEIRRASDAQLDELAGQIVQRGDMQRGFDTGLQVEKAELMQELRQRIVKELTQRGETPGTASYEEKYKYALAFIEQKADEKLGEVRAEFRQTLPQKVTTQLRQIRAGAPADAQEAAIRQQVMSQLAALKRMPERYAEGIAETSAGWIHTPVVVLSANHNTMATSVGGYNLSARVTKFIKSEAVPKGRVRVDLNGNVLLNPADLPKAKDLVRIAGRNERNTIGQIEAALNSRLQQARPVAPQPPQAAMKLPPGGGGKPPQPPTALPSGSFPEPPSDPLKSIWHERREAPGAILVSRNDQSRAITILHSDEPGAPAFKAADAADATDATLLAARRHANPEQPLVLELHGWQPHEAEAFMKSLEIQAAGDKVPAEFVGIVRNRMAGREAAYDFSRARMLEAQPRGASQRVITVEVPPMNGAGEVGLIEAELSFGQSAKPPVIEAVTRRVQRAVGGLVTEFKNRAVKFKERVALTKFNVRMAAAVKKVSRRTGVDVRLNGIKSTGNGNDIYFVRKEARDGDDAPGVAPGEAAGLRAGGGHSAHARTVLGRPRAA